MAFQKGMEVEVFSDEKDLRGALFVATVIRSVSRRNKVLIEYQTLVADEEGSKPLREMVDVVYLRPIPPREKARRFEVSDEVDAYHNDCWWEGVVIRVLENGRYVVYFRSGKEELEFEGCEMRIHREWVRGVWVPPMEEDDDVGVGAGAHVQDMNIEQEEKPEVVGVAHVQHKEEEQDTETDQTQSSHVNDSADIVNVSNTRNHKIELPSCNIEIPSPCKKLKKEVSKKSLVREPVPRFDKERTDDILGYDRSAGHRMLDDFSLSPVYNSEEHCKSSKSQGRYSQDKRISQSCKKLIKETETGSSFPLDTEMSTSATPNPLEKFRPYPEPEKKSTTALQNARSGGHPMLNDFSLSPLDNCEDHCDSSKSSVQCSPNSSVAQSFKKLKMGDETENVIALPNPCSELSAQDELKEKTRSATDYDRSGGHSMLDDFNLSPLYNIEDQCELSKSRLQYSQNNLIAESCKKTKKGNEPGSSFSMTQRLKEMSMGAIRIGSDFDHDMSLCDPTVDIFGLSPLLDIEGEQSISCTQVHCSQNNLIQY